MNTRKRTLAILLTAVFLLATAGLTAAMMIPSADELLVQSLETLETVTDGHAIIEVTAELPDETMSGTFEVWGKLDVGPNGEPAARIEVLAASEAELVGVTAVTDGVQFWLYDPGTNTVIVGQAAEMATMLAERMAASEGEWGDMGQWQHDGDFAPEAAELPETPAEVVARLLEYFTAERNGSDLVAGSNAYRLRLVPIPEQMPEEVRAAGGFINVWLRSNDQLPVAVEYAEGALGYGKIEATLAEINTDLDEAIFTFDIPEDATVMQATDLLAAMETEMGGKAEVPAGFVALTAAVLPDGAVAAEPQQIRGTHVQRYTLPGDLSFVVAQGGAVPMDVPAGATSEDVVTVRGVEGTLYADNEGGRTLLAWQENGVTFIVAGDISPEDALAVAESLR